MSRGPKMTGSLRVILDLRRDRRQPRREEVAGDNVYRRHGRSYCAAIKRDNATCAGVKQA